MAALRVSDAQGFPPRLTALSQEPTLGEHPDKVDPRYQIRLDPWTRSEFDLGRFVRDSERWAAAPLPTRPKLTLR